MYLACQKNILPQADPMKHSYSDPLTDFSVWLYINLVASANSGSCGGGGEDSSHGNRFVFCVQCGSCHRHFHKSSNSASSVKEM